MSASTVSITANPATRRRPVVATEKKSNIELLAAEPQSKAADDKSMAANARDLSHHSIRGDAVLERSSRDAVQVKKTAATSTVSPPSSRRGRKAVAASRPRWLTLLSIFTKNFVLLIVLVGLVQMVRRLALRSGDVGGPFPLSDYEGRIAELEKFVKTAATMIQVQVEVVDRKIDSKVEGLREEVGKNIEEKSKFLESQLKELDVRSEGIERSFGEFKDINWMSKEEFEKVYEELKKARNVEFGGGEGENLNDIRAYARDLVLKEIEKHAADGLGRVDYALATGGAMVVKHSEPFSKGKGSKFFAMSGRNGVHSDADKMLKPSFGEPGHCFPLKGSSGFVQIKLRTAIIPEAVTLEHVAKSVAFDRSSAPKDCRISGWLQGQNTESTYDTLNMVLLTEFTYDLEKSNAQTYNVLESASSSIIDTVRFDFTSNHGSPSHTCIYRLRVHGHEPESVAMMRVQS